MFGTLNILFRKKQKQPMFRSPIVFCLAMTRESNLKDISTYYCTLHAADLVLQFVGQLQCLALSSLQRRLSLLQLGLHLPTLLPAALQTLLDLMQQQQTHSHTTVLRVQRSMYWIANGKRWWWC